MYVPIAFVYISSRRSDGTTDIAPDSKGIHIEKYWPVELQEKVEKML